MEWDSIDIVNIITNAVRTAMKEPFYTRIRGGHMDGMSVKFRVDGEYMQLSAVSIRKDTGELILTLKRSK